MDSWRRAVAAAEVEARRAELGLTQSDLGVAADTYRDFVKGRSWPHARTRATIEVKLGWDVGEIFKLAQQASGGGGIADLIQAAQDRDERALLTSNLADDVKRRLIARLWAAKTRRPRDEGETGTSQIL